MLLITNSEMLHDRGWTDGGLFKSIHDRIDHGHDVSINLYEGHTTKERSPIVNGFKVELSHKGWPFVNLYMFDVGRDDDYFVIMTALVEKFKSLEEKERIPKRWDKQAVALQKMKDLAYKFASQYSDPGYLIVGIANRAYSRGTDNGKWQIQESMKKLLNVKES